MNQLAVYPGARSGAAALIAAGLAAWPGHEARAATHSTAASLHSLESVIQETRPGREITCECPQSLAWEQVALDIVPSLICTGITALCLRRQDGGVPARQRRPGGARRFTDVGTVRE